MKPGWESAVKTATEADAAHVVDEFEGNIIVLPAHEFDDEELPDVDLGPYLVEVDGEPCVPIPRHLPRSYRGGLHVLAPHHLAMMWADLDAGALRKEVNLREEHDLPIPDVARTRLEREVYR